MMFRTPAGRQKRPSPSPEVHVERLETILETKTAPSPSKKPRRPYSVDVEEPDEPYSLRTYQRGSPWDNAKKTVVRKEQVVREFAIKPYAAAENFVDSDNEDERELDWDSLRCSYKCRNLVKSDVLMSLESSEKQVVELKAVVEKLRASSASSDGERRKLRKQVLAMEQGLAAANEREKALYKQRTQESDKNGELVKTHMNRCAELQAKLQAEMKKHAEVQARALVLETQVTAAEDGKEKAFQSAAREASKLRHELRRVQEDSLLSVARVNVELEAQKGQSLGAALEAERLNSELKVMHNSMAENLAERLKLEHQIFDADIQTSSTRTTGAAEADLVIKHLKEELSQCEAEVRDARKVKAKHVNVELLKERLASEKVRADRAEAAVSSLANLELKVKELEGELSSWKGLMTTLPGVKTRSDVALKFAELQRELVAAISRVGEVNAEMAKLQTAVDIAENARLQAKAVADAAQAEAADAVLNLKRAERKVLLLAKERDGFKAVLTSYDEEESIIASHQKSDISNLSSPGKAKEYRVQQLEQALADAQGQAKLLGGEVESSLKSCTEQRHRAEGLSLMLAESEEKYKALEREARQLRSEVSVLEGKIGRGESNATATKILHMMINPEAEVHEPSQVQALRARLELHERQFDGRREESLLTNSEHGLEKVNVLMQRVSALEKREVRYKQVFANKISVFREACGLIFGYKMKMNEQQDSSTGSSITLFTLRSIYSTSEEEQIEFQFKDGNLEMLLNDYTSSPELQRQVITFLRNFKSIPAFIANVTMEQFNKSTIG